MADSTKCEEQALVLRNEIQHKLVPNEWQEREFLPDDDFRSLFNRKAIRDCMPGAPPALVDRVSRELVKVFAIFIYLGNRPKGLSLAQAMQKCIDYGLVDDKLPIDGPKQIRNLSKDARRELEEEHFRRKPELTIFRQWGSIEWKTFYDKQFLFLAPVFVKGALEHTLASNTILPVTEDMGESGRGYFGTVQKVNIHAQHLRGFSGDQENDRCVAIKSFKETMCGSDGEMSARRAFENEKRVLVRMAKLSHPHLLDFIAAVNMDTKFVLISEWADGGDLRKFWSKMPTPVLSAEFILDVLEQIQGLADALHFLHSGRYSKSARESHAHFSRTPTLSTAISSSVPRIQLPPGANTDDDDDARSQSPHMRHGDLKPENILVFDPVPGRLGTLKIADFGLTKHHDRATKHRMEPTQMEYGTRSYEAPEASLYVAGPRSRLYDIWSFGCIMLETVVWLLEGQDGLNALRENGESRDQSKSIQFYTMAGGIQVAPKIVLRMNELLANTAVHGTQGTTALNDMLRLVKDQLLVVALPDPPEAALGGHRIDADRLVQELTKMLNKADSMTYLNAPIRRRDSGLQTIVQRGNQARLAPNGSRQQQFPDSHLKPSRIVSRGGRSPDAA